MPSNTEHMTAAEYANTLLNVNTLKASRWKSPTLKAVGRIYINDLQGLYGLQVERYNTGNINWAAVGGKEISNTRGTRLFRQLNDGKLWYDIASGSFHSKGMDVEVEGRLVTEIARRVDEALATA